MKLLCIKVIAGNKYGDCPDLTIDEVYTLREVFEKGVEGYIPWLNGFRLVTLYEDFYSLMEFGKDEIYPSSCFVPLDGTEECGTLTIEELLKESPVVKELV